MSEYVRTKSYNYDKPIVIQKMNDDETWSDAFRIHANINKSKTDNEYLNSGAIHAKKYLVFTVRYFKELEDISYNLQMYRIMYHGVPWDITDYDDFQLQHKSVQLLGGSY